MSTVDVTGVITGTLPIGRGRRVGGRRRLTEERVHEGRGADVEGHQGRIPRVSRLMALAIRCEALLAERVIANQAALARIGGVSRARVTQIMNLLHLAPAIQESILFLRVERGRAPVLLADLQPIARVLSWETQWGMWEKVNRKI